MRLGITGGSGYLGQNLLEALHDSKFSGKILIHEKKLISIPPRFSQIPGDVREINSLRELFTDIDVAIHCASIVSATDKMNTDLMETNVNGTKNVIHACIEKKVKRLIYIGSSQAHIINQAEVLSEKSPLVDENNHKGAPYDLTKMLAQREVLAARYQIEVVVIGPAGLLGPVEAQLSLFGKTVIQMYRGQLPALIEGGYHWIDVRDVVTTIIKALDAPCAGEVFLLAEDRITIKEIADITHECGGKKPPLLILPISLLRFILPVINFFAKFFGIQPPYTRSYLLTLQSPIKRIDNSKVKKMLNIKFRRSRQSLKEMVQWFKDNDYLPQ